MSASAAAAAAVAAGDGADGSGDSWYQRKWLAYGDESSSDDDIQSQWLALAQITLREAVVMNPEDERGQRSFGVMKRGPMGFRTNSSDFGTICGLNPHKHPLQAYEEIRAQQMGTWERKPMERAQQHGVTCEPLIFKLFERVMGCTVQPSAFFRHCRPELAPLFGASPDGIVLSRGMAKDGYPEGTPFAVLEIKAPTGEQPVIWDNYVAQMMAQMWMSGLKHAFFFSVWLKQDPVGTQKEHFGVLGPKRTTPAETKTLLLKLDYSPEYMAWMLPRMTLFSKCLVDQVPPRADLYASEVTWREDPPAYTSTPVNVETSALRVEKNPRGSVKAAKAALAAAAGSGASAAAAAVTS